MTLVGDDWVGEQTIPGEQIIDMSQINMEELYSTINPKNSVPETPETPTTQIVQPTTSIMPNGWLKRELFIKNINGREYIFDSHLFNIIYEPARQPAWKNLFIILMDEFISLYDQVGPMINIEEQQFILRPERFKNMSGLTILKSIHPVLEGVNINGIRNPEIIMMIRERLLPLKSYEGDEVILVYKNDRIPWDAYRMFYNIAFIYKTAFSQMDTEKWSHMNEMIFGVPLGNVTGQLKSKKYKTFKKSSKKKKKKKKKSLKNKKKSNK